MMRMESESSSFLSYFLPFFLLLYSSFFLPVCFFCQIFLPSLHFFFLPSCFLCTVNKSFLRKIKFSPFFFLSLPFFLSLSFFLPIEVTVSKVEEWSCYRWTVYLLCTFSSGKKLVRRQSDFFLLSSPSFFLPLLEL